MATLDAPLRPQWIFETLRLWQPQTPFPVYVEQAMDLAAQELPTPATRRRALSQIFRLYVSTRGRGPYRRTLDQNVWAAYCRAYRPHVLSPAFLTQLVAATDITQALGAFFQQNAAPGTPITPAQVRSYLDINWPAHTFSPGQINIWLRTLAHFQVLTPAPRPDRQNSEQTQTGPDNTPFHSYRIGNYQVRRPLPVAGGIFPLLVYSWAGTRRQAVIEPSEFARDVILAYVERDGFDHYWRLYAGLLWHAETRRISQAVSPQKVWRLRYPEPEDMARMLINLLTSHRRPRRYVRLSQPRAISPPS